jgi:hypothetical protein
MRRRQVFELRAGHTGRNACVTTLKVTQTFLSVLGRQCVTSRAGL